MSFPFSIYLLCLGLSTLLSLLSFPIWKRLSEKMGLLDAPGHRKIHSSPTPLAGGLTVLFSLGCTSVVLVLLLFFDVLWSPGSQTALDYGISQRNGQIFSIGLGSLGMFALGLVDDRWVLSPSKKFAFQFLIAALVASSGIRITLFIPSVLMSYGLTILWILTVTNAFNFCDNMNGLSGGLGFLGAFFFGLEAAIKGQYLVSSLAWLMAGSILGFLPHNYPRAKSFLGDSGSHLIGFWLAVLAILPHFYSGPETGKWTVMKPLFFLAIPLLDLAWVVSWRTWHGKPFYIGDTNHLSHQLVRKGLTRPRAVAVLWLAAAFLGALLTGIQTFS